MREVQKQKTEQWKKRMRTIRAMLCFLAALFFVVPFAHAQLDTGLDPLTATGLGTADIRVTVASIIRVFLGLLGVIAIVLVLYGGFLWMTAAGNEEKITKAKQILLNAAIGLAIILSAYALTAFVLSRLLSGTTGAGIGDDDGLQAPGGGIRGALGGGIVESHYPERNAINIPRNTKIIVTFKEPMRRATIMNDNGTPNDLSDDRINPTTIHLYKAIADQPTANDFITNIRATATPDDTTFIFAPELLLGSPSEPISYTMRLENGIKKANGDDAFGRFGSFYAWTFEVSTVIDVTPPTVVSVIPTKDTTHPRNVIVQLTMSEPIDPTMVVGSVATSALRVTDEKNARVQGTTSIANGYRTVEFVTDNFCGRNSCGGDVFCFSANDTITVQAPSAALTSDRQDAPFTATLPFTGIVDLAGNALDGNANGMSDGPGNAPEKDDVLWSFHTNDTIDLTPPRIEALNPAHDAARVAPERTLRVSFSKPLMASTFNASSVALDPMINYWTTTDLVSGKTVGVIHHDPFRANTAYAPVVSSGVKDLYQNCYFPCAGLSCSGTSWTGYPSCKLP